MLRVDRDTMGFFSRIFGGGGRIPLPLEEVEKLTAPLAVPALHFVTAPGVSASYLGGEPVLPSGLSWPEKDGKPLRFLANIDLASVAQVLPLDWLPRDGRLLFFYDIEGQPWGFDPKDRGSWVVIHGSGSAPPPPSAGHVPLRFLSPRRIASLPSYERPEIAALELTDEQTNALIEISCATYGDAPYHQLAGYPHPIQSDAMELECQLASNGIKAGEPAAYETPRATALADAARDWRLLLQVDGDDALNLMWGDAGIIYFWIREQDARARRFDNVWLVLQCH